LTPFYKPREEHPAVGYSQGNEAQERPNPHWDESGAGLLRGSHLEAKDREQIEQRKSKQGEGDDLPVDPGLSFHAGEAILAQTS